MQSTPVGLEAIINKGLCVYALSWDTGGPFGGSGCERVYRLNGSYAVLLDDGEESGPYSTLHEAISAAEQLYMVGPATTTIESAQLSAEDILALLKPFDGLDEPALTIKINDSVRTIKTA